MSVASLSAMRDSRILVVGSVMLDRQWLDELDGMPAKTSTQLRHIKRRQARAGKAADIAHQAAELGALVGLLGMGGRGEEGESDQLMQFNALLPQYDVIVLSDAEKIGASNVRKMISAANCMGKCIVANPADDDLSCYAGTNLLASSRAQLLRALGAWNSEFELTNKAQRLRELLQLEALLLTRGTVGLTLYTDRETMHFSSGKEKIHAPVICDAMIAIMAVMLGAGTSVHEAVSAAYHPVPGSGAAGWYMAEA